MAEAIRAQHPDVDKLIACVKQVFVKAPLRRMAFKEAEPNLPLPPEPVLTRWGTWLKAAEYYAQNYERVRAIVHRLNPCDAQCIENAQRAFESPTIVSQLAYIKANFSLIPEAITALESHGLTLEEAIENFNRVATQIRSTHLKDKIESVIGANPGYQALSTISQILSGNHCPLPDDLELEPHELVAFKFAPVTSCDVERSFSKYKYLLADRRRSFEFENFKMHLVLSCNSEKDG